MIRWCVGLLVAAVIPLVVPIGPAEAGDPLRVLIIGDSVTHGTTGDWTWRYRLWEQFQAAAVPVDFVGPRDDLYDIETSRAGSHGYLDPAFDQDHAAQWGLSLGALDGQVELIATYRPDVLVEMLGVNDIVFGDRTTTQVVGLLDALVADARAADPNVDVVLVPPFEQWFPGVLRLDAALPGLAADLDSPASHIVASDLSESDVGPSDCLPGTPAQPAATGELKIAVSVAAALAQIGVPIAFLDPLPVVENGPPDPAHLVLRRVRPHAVDISWLLPLGANQARMWQRDLTVKQRWQRLDYALTAHRWTSGTW